MGLARLTLLHIHGDGAQQAIRLGLAMYRAQEILAQHIVEAAADGQIRQAANELAKCPSGVVSPPEAMAM